MYQYDIYIINLEISLCEDKYFSTIQSNLIAMKILKSRRWEKSATPATSSLAEKDFHIVQSKLSCPFTSFPSFFWEVCDFFVSCILLLVGTSCRSRWRKKGRNKADTVGTTSWSMKGMVPGSVVWIVLTNNEA